MSEPEQPLVVAIEDVATAGIVAAHAAHVAADLHVGAVLLLHVRDEHTVLSGIYGMANLGPQVESDEECSYVLGLAEATLRAEMAALGRPEPSVRHYIASGSPATVIERAAVACRGVGIVMGARRPHALGRLTHPDVRASLAAHTAIPIYLAALQAE